MSDLKPQLGLLQILAISNGKRIQTTSPTFHDSGSISLLFFNFLYFHVGYIYKNTFSTIYSFLLLVYFVVSGIKPRFNQTNVRYVFYHL